MIRRTVVMMLSGISVLTLSRVIEIGLISAVKPSMKSVLNMLEPTMLPIAMSALPFKAPVRLTTSSGVDVPMPTIVKPITNSLNPAFLAIVDEPSTSQSAPSTTSASPASRIRISVTIIFYINVTQI